MWTRRRDEKFKVKFEPLTILNEPKEEFSTIEGIYDSIDNGIPGWSKSNIVTASGKQDLADILTCFAFTEVYKKSAAENDFSLLNETVCKNIHNHMKVEVCDGWMRVGEVSAWMWCDVLCFTLIWWRLLDLF